MVGTGRVQIVVDTADHVLTLFAGGRVMGTWPVAVGEGRTPTPLGHWTVVQAEAGPPAFGGGWWQLNIPWGRYGLVGAGGPAGSTGTRGCVRLPGTAARVLGPAITVGTPVDIRGVPFSGFGELPRRIVVGDVGSDVLQVQQRLRALDPALPLPDGVYGDPWPAAVRRFQATHGLPVTGVVDARTALALGVVPVGEDPTLRPRPRGAPVRAPPPR
jgi:hypothetical protein